jgi:hypothetical protein
MTQALGMIRALNHDIKAFNLQYKDLIRQLAQQGGTFPDGKVFVEEAYLDSPDKQLVRFIQHLQDQDRMEPPGCTMEELMNLAEGKVNQMKVLEEHKATDTGKQQELLALKAKLDTLKKAVHKFKKDKSGYESSDSSAGGSRSGGGSKPRHRGKSKRNDPSRKPFPE